MKKIVIGDSVKVISGKHRGIVSTVVSFTRKGNFVHLKDIVATVVHRKSTDSVSGRSRLLTPIHQSNVLFCGESGVCSRTSFSINGSGDSVHKTRVRKNK
jgi:ribosomal protein L24